MVFNISIKFSISNGNRYITDGNDIRPHTEQIYNKRTSTDLSLVTAQSTVHEPTEDGPKKGPKHVGANFKCF